MAHASDVITIDATLHSDLKHAAAAHPAASLADSPLAKALASDNAATGQITNSTLTAYASAVENGPLTGMAEPARAALIERIHQAFPGR